MQGKERLVTPTEKALTQTWAEVLRRDSVGLDDDFFALGGNSLISVRMAGLLHERLGIEAPIDRLAEHRTVAAFARLIDESAAGAEQEQGLI
jgi:acyl carrier protein